ncbi:MAG: thioesterase family protein [Sneathiella sp.]
MSDLLSPKLIPGFRGAVETWECDQMLHMNVQFYMSKASASFAHLQNALGLTPARIRKEKKALAFQSLRIQYKSEMRMGESMHGFSGIRSVSGDIVTGFIHLFDSRKNVLSGVYEFTARYTDLLSGEKLSLPAHVRDRAAAFVDEHSDQYLPAPMKCMIMPATHLDHMFETSRSAVDVWECDAYSNMEMQPIVGRFSDAAGHVMGRVGMTREMQKERNLGSAALDYYTEFHSPVKVATSLILKSALLDRKPKNFIFGHIMINADTNKIVSNTTVLGCYFDMTARKSVPLPLEYMSIPEEQLLRFQLA